MENYSNLKIVEIGKHILINGDPNEALRYLLSIKMQVDFIVSDPDYREIGKYLKTDHYENLRKLLKNNSSLLHYTFNADSNAFCKESIDHILINKLSTKGLRYKTKIYWHKYPGQKLITGKKSWSKKSPAKDLDILVFFVKRSNRFNTKVNLDLLHKGSSIIKHDAVQKEQFKPNTLCNDIVKALTVKDDIILDSFMGSGNLGEETMLEDRIYIGIESNEKLFNETHDKLLRVYLNTLKHKEVMLIC